MASVRSSKGSLKQPLASEHDFASLQEIQDLIDGLVEQIALIRPEGTIVAVNRSWRRLVERRARTGLYISRDYIRFLRSLIEDGDEGAKPLLAAFLDLGAGSNRTFKSVYKGHGVFEGYDFNVVIASLSVHGTRYLLVSVHDVTELVSLKRQRRQIGGQLLRAHDNERRRIARELHDSTSQMLVVLQSHLARLKGHAGPEGEAIVDECKEAVQEIHREIRTFSFLAHPPALVGNNLSEALEDLVRGFAARVGLEIEVEAGKCGQVSASIEAALYRITQEALANIHRHSGATQVRVRLVGRVHHVHLMIRDNGVGYAVSSRKERQSMGVGVAGMGERVRELGGRLSISRSEQGTALIVSFAREKRMVFARQIGTK